MYGVRECSNFILLHVAVQFSQQHLLKKLRHTSTTFHQTKEVRGPAQIQGLRKQTPVLDEMIARYECKHEKNLWSFL